MEGVRKEGGSVEVRIQDLVEDDAEDFWAAERESS